MSTRANVVIKDKWDEVFFYRHSDGYPSGTMPSLEKFLGWVKEGRIRDNVSQSAGWLVMLGNAEYDSGQEPKQEGYSGWKVGAFEPTTCIHGDVEHIYVIDLEKKEIRVDSGEY